MTRPFQCVAIELMEYKSSSLGFKYARCIIDHHRRFLMFVPVHNKLAPLTVRALVERVFAVFSQFET